MEMKYCPFCGSQLMKNAKFCSQCGKPVSNVQEAETQEEKMVQQTLDAVDALEAPALSPKHDAP